jgi:hypothetical protein
MGTNVLKEHAAFMFLFYPEDAGFSQNVGI